MVINNNLSVNENWARMYEKGDTIISRLWAIFVTLHMNLWVVFIVIPIFLLLVCVCFCVFVYLVAKESLLGLEESSINTLELIQEIQMQKIPNEDSGHENSDNENSGKIHDINNKLSKLIKESKYYKIMMCSLSYIILISMLVVVFVFREIFMYFFGDLNEDQIKDISMMFGQSIYFCKHDFEVDFISSIKEIKGNHLSVLFFIISLLISVLSEIMFAIFLVKPSVDMQKKILKSLEGLTEAKGYEDTKQLKLTLEARNKHAILNCIVLPSIQKLLMISIFLCYIFISASNDFTSISPNHSSMIKSLNSNKYMRRTYFAKCMNIIDGAQSSPSEYKNKFMLFSVFIYLLIEIFGLYYCDIISKDHFVILKQLKLSEDEIKHLKSKNINILAYRFGLIFRFVLELAELEPCIFGCILIVYFWRNGSREFFSYMSSIGYVMNTYNSFCQVVYDRSEMRNIFSLDNIGSLELSIEEYKTINISYDKFNTTSEVYFFANFEKLLYSGDISGARDYAISKAPNEQCKEMALNIMNDKSNVLLKDVGMSFISKCNSFYSKKHDKYVSLASNRGRIILLSGPSGAGKSTIANALLGDSNYFVSFVNKKPAYLIDAQSRSLFNYYSEKYVPFLDSLNLRQNLQIADPDVLDDESFYIFNKMSISQYFGQLDYLLSLMRFSHGQYSRTLISRLFVALNGIVKEAGESISDKSVKYAILSSIKSDDCKLSNIDSIKLRSFFVVLDEPLSVLDHEAANNLMKMVRKYSELGFTFLIIDHSGIVSKYADDIIEIKDRSCEYYTKVDGSIVNIDDLNFGENDNLIIGDTIASLSNYNKLSSVVKTKEDYLNGKLKDISICNISSARVSELLKILNDRKLHKDLNGNNEKLDGLDMNNLNKIEFDDGKSEVSTNISDIGSESDEYKSSLIEDDGNMTIIYE